VKSTSPVPDPLERRKGLELVVTNEYVKRADGAPLVAATICAI
jgi:hypothetical protein